MLFSEMGESLLQLTQPQVSAGTHNNYRLSLLKWIELMGDGEVSSITPQNVELWKNKASVKMKPNGVSIYFRSLKALWNRALKMGMITGENPFTKVQNVRILVGSPEWITPEDHEKILKCVAGNGFAGRASLRRLFTFLFHTGMRSSEVLALRVEDIDFKDKVALIKAVKTNTLRGVPLNSSALHSITKELEVSGVKSGRIWRYTLSGVSHSFLFAKRRAGITKDISFYSYRHSVATRLLKKRVPMEVVSKILGHSSIATTIKFYSAFDTGQLREGMDMLE
jgi:integrase